MTRLALVVLAVLLHGVAAPASAQAPATAPLPTGEAVLTRYIEATGGTAAYEAVKNRVIQVKMEIVGSGVTIFATIYQARPARTYTVAEADAIGKVESGVADGVVWEKSDLRGAVIKEGQERDDALRDAVFDRLANFRSAHKKVECVALETVEGKQAFKVVMTPNVGSELTVYFDRDSGLVVKTETTVDTPQGRFPVTAFPGDYRQVANGIRTPFVTRVQVAGQTRINSVVKIEQNVELPADRFALPAEIKALIAAKKVPAGR